MSDIHWFVILALALLALVSFPGIPNIKGVIGESKVSRLLQKLPPEEYHLFNDVMLPARQGTTQIDHVLLSRFGVFVIETKNMSGWIFGSADQAKWTQVLYRKKRQFQNPLRQNHAHVKAIEQALELPSSAIHSLVAFVGDARPKSQFPSTVTWNGVALINQIRMKQGELLSEEQLEQLIEKLKAARLPDTRKTRRDHVRRLRDRHS